MHVLTHTLHYGLGVFEGIRCYRTARRALAVFRLEEHVERLFDSAHINLLEMPFSREQIDEAILETLRANQLAEGYLRPLVFLGDGAMGLDPADNPIRVAIVAWPWGAYLGDEGIERGIRAKVSSFSRHHVNTKMTKGKTCGDYVNSILAKREALLDGYDEAHPARHAGLRGRGERREHLHGARRRAAHAAARQPCSSGITRDDRDRASRATRASPVEERAITRDELYIADEVFLTGTAAEVTPVREIDRRQIGAGSRGPITNALQGAFFDVVAGRDRKYERWLTYL